VIDLHCHVLPGVDDGPATLDEALALVLQASGDGITTIAATPHVDWTHPAVDAATVAAGVAELQAAIDAAGIDVRLAAGAEVALTRAADLDAAELAALRLGGGPWLLLECPIRPAETPGFAAGARALARQGHRLLLAHPERSPVFLRAPELLDELVAEGALAQVTAGALSGVFGGTVRRAALGFVHAGAVQVVASDGHGAHRPATIAPHLAAAGIDPSLASWLARDVPAAVLAGAPIPRRPDVPPPGDTARRSLRRLFGS